MRETKLLMRNEVPAKEMWDLSVLFASREDMFREAEEILKRAKDLAELKGSFIRDAGSFYDFLNRYEALQSAWQRVANYPSLAVSVDSSSAQALEDASKMRAMTAEFFECLSFVKVDICKLSREDLDRFYTEEPELANFERFVEDTFKYKAHLLSEESEALLASFSGVLNAPGYIYDVSSSADMSFEPFQDAQGKLLPNSFTLFEEKYQDDSDTAIRRNAFESFHKGLQNYVNTYASVYATEVERQRIEARLRGFDSTIDMLLFDQGIDRAVYDTHLKVLFEELAPQMRRYAKILKKQLGAEELKFADLKTALDEEYSPSAAFDDVKETILSALNVYGDEYLDNIKRMFDAGLIDYAQNVGKSSGAFCCSPHGADSFIMMTFTGTMRSAFTLVHELGHAGHFYLANKYQNALVSECSMYCVEAPSTINELILASHLKAQAASREVERWVILQNLASYYHNCVTHFLEAHLQDRVYKHIDRGGQINAAFLNQTKLDVIRAFWADSVNVEEEAGMTWMRQGHYYMGLYPYTYSASLSIATQMFKKIENEGASAIEKWLEVLKAGGSLTSADLMKKVDIDISKPDMFVSLAEYVGSLIDRLEELYE